ncbi:type II toxin-antitoxin system VapC family toxin [Terrimonas alba]|uniref:type II toxin-antitoxin system VapC family toxin n=1 Tax=Terrimonas alba TaxID=3349636 RepID=UPI0035F35276
MNYKVFLDVNILIDFFDGSRQHHESAKHLMELIEGETITGYFSESVVNTTVYLIQKGYTPKELRKTIKELLEIMTLAPCSNKTIQAACQLPTNDLEDAVLYQIALENQLDYFITHDKAAYKKLSSSALPVVTAGEFFKILAEQ